MFRFVKASKSWFQQIFKMMTVIHWSVYLIQ